MAIRLIEGEGGGSGKSFLVAGRAVEHIRTGGTVFAADSLCLCWGECTELRNREYRPGIRNVIMKKYGLVPSIKQLTLFPVKDTLRLHEVTPMGTDEKPLLVQVDEAHDDLNAREWNDKEKAKAKKALFEYFTQHRHHSNDIDIITQHIDNIDSQIRRLANSVLIVENLAIIYERFWILVVLFGKFFRITTMDQNKKYRSAPDQWKIKDRDIFGCYISKSMVVKHVRSSRVPVGMVKLEKVEGYKEKRMIKLALIALAALIIYLGFRTRQNFRDLDKVKHPAGLSVAPLDVPKQKQTPVPVQTVIVRSAPKASYSVVTETFRGTDFENFLVTEKDEYYVKQVCSKGMVKAITSYCAEIVAPDGSLVYVVARGGPVAIRSDLPARSPAVIAERKGRDVAEWTPEPHPFSDAEQSRIRASLGKGHVTSGSGKGQ